MTVLQQGVEVWILMNTKIEFQNDTDESFNVMVCRSKATGKLYVHLLGDKEEMHEQEATEIEGMDYEIVDVKDVAWVL